MKKANKSLLLIFSSLMLLIISIIGLIGCSDNNSSGSNPPDTTDCICFENLTVNGMSVNGIVSNSTTTFSFIDEISKVGSANYIVSFDVAGITDVPSKTIPLSIGNNTVYIIETINEEPTNIYTVTIRRRPLFTVSFNTNGGNFVDNVIVEEGFCVEKPFVEKQGFTLKNWDYDFDTPITDDITISCSWQARTDVPYTIEYYQENLNSLDYTNKSNYTLIDRMELLGTTGSKIYPVFDKYEHFSVLTYVYLLIYSPNTGIDKEDIPNPIPSDVEGIISSDGSSVLKVYYTRNRYEITAVGIDNNGEVFGSGSYIYGKQVTLTAYVNNGYTFDGWYKGNQKVSSNTTYSFYPQENADFVAKWSGSLNTISLDFNNYDCNGENLVYAATGSSIVLPSSANPDYTIYWAKTQTSEPVYKGGDTYTVGKDSLQTLYAVRKQETSSGLVWEVESNSINIVDFTNYRNEIIIPQRIAGYNVKKILEGAFLNATSLTSITIGNNITTIEKGAFEGCSKLEYMSLPFVGSFSSKYNNYWMDMFGYIFGYTTSTSSSLTGKVCQYQSSNTYYHYNIPSSLREIHVLGGKISANAFSNCNFLTKVVVGNDVTSIGLGAFKGCSNLQSMTLPFVGSSLEPSDYKTSLFGYIFGGVTTSGSSTPNNTVYQGYNEGLFYYFYIPANIRNIILGNGNIGNNAFLNCSSIESISISDKTTEIAEGAFIGCSSLSNFIVDNNNANYKSINGSLFSKNGETLISYAFGSSTTSYTIPNTVKYIAERAFSGSKNLLDISLGNLVENVGKNAFNFCSNLRSITVDVNNKNYSSIDGNLYNKDTTILICYASGKGDTDFTIPNSVVCIDSYAFYSSKNLTYIRISKFVTHIGNYAFAYCSSVKNIYFEDNSTWYYTEDLEGWKELTGGKTINVSGSSTIAVFLTDTMYSYYYTYFYKTE